MKRTVLVLAALAAAAPSAHAASRPAPDRRPPAVAISTPERSVRAWSPANHELTTVTGTASDDRSGVASVKVTYCTGHKFDGGGWVCTGTGVEAHGATLSCAKLSCTWTAQVPMLPGHYLAFARAADKARNEAGAGPVTVIVV